MSLTTDNNLLQKGLAKVGGVAGGGESPQVGGVGACPQACPLSILMPIYNGSEFLPESVSSVIRQTCWDWELLIAINGYEPESQVFVMVRDYIKAIGDLRIRVLDYHDCKGKPATLNKMLGECKYNYVALLDVDDVWLPEKLDVQQPFLRKDYDVVGTKCVYFGEMNNIVPAIPTGDISALNFLQVNPLINSSAIIKKALAHWDVNCFVEDYDLWLRLRKDNRRFYNCPEVVVKHRIHKESAFNAKGNDNYVAALRLKYS
jgi:glycosyltransferase involved in cell wall biosynthesis